MADTTTDGRCQTWNDYTKQFEYTGEFKDHLIETLPKTTSSHLSTGVNIDTGDIVYGGQTFKPTPKSPLSTDAAERKRTPVWSGFVKYFPRAIVAIAKVSFAGNEQHNPGQPLHWAKEKSKDHLDTAFRHLIDHLFNPVDTDGQLHLAKAGWRINAALETYLEEQDARNQVSRS